MKADCYPLLSLSRSLGYLFTYPQSERDGTTGKVVLLQKSKRRYKKKVMRNGYQKSDKSDKGILCVHRTLQHLERREGKAWEDQRIICPFGLCRGHLNLITRYVVKKPLHS